MICPLPLELLLEMTRSDLKAFSFSVTFPLAMNEKKQWNNISIKHSLHVSIIKKEGIQN